MFKVGALSLVETGPMGCGIGVGSRKVYSCSAVGGVLFGNTCSLGESGAMGSTRCGIGGGSQKVGGALLSRLKLTSSPMAE